MCFWDVGATKLKYFLSNSHDLSHKVIGKVWQINVNVLQKITEVSFIFLIFTFVKVYVVYIYLKKPE